MDEDQVVATYMDHTLPLLMLISDFCVNRIYFEFWQWPVNVIILLIYGMVNMTVTLVTNHPVYSIMPWNSFGSVMVALAMPILFMFVWVAFFYISKGKFALISSDAQKVEE